MSDTRSETTWRLLMTVADAPTAAVLAGLLEADGISVRIASDAAVLGQAAAARLYVYATQWQRAASLVASAGSFTDEELTDLATGDAADDEQP